MSELYSQAIRGITPPQVAEARIAVRWPSVAAFPAVAKLGSSIQEFAKGLFLRTISLPTVLAAILLVFVFPLCTLIAFAAWFLLAPFYFRKIMPVMMTRYLLTNRRICIQKGWRLRVVEEVPLEAIEAVRVVEGSEQPFYLAADLEIISGGRPAMVLRGVKEFQQFQRIIEDAYKAWGRKEAPKEQAVPASQLAKWWAQAKKAEQTASS